MIAEKQLVNPETIPGTKFEEHSKLERFISAEKKQTFWRNLIQ